MPSTQLVKNMVLFTRLAHIREAPNSGPAQCHHMVTKYIVILTSVIDLFFCIDNVHHRPRGKA